MGYSRQKVVATLNSKTLPLDLVYECYLEECAERKFKAHEINSFQNAINVWIRMSDTDLNEYLVKRFQVNTLEKDGEILKYY